MNLTTRSTLFLLAAMVGTVCGDELGAVIRGVTTTEESCSDKVLEGIYEECVEGVAVSMGVVGPTRRLELRGSRDLTTTGSTCGTCRPEGCKDGKCWPYGHWCYAYKCEENYRRLTVADEYVHTERFLHDLGAFQQAANACLDSKVTEYPCLGKLEELTIKVYYSE
jgi:hypothetical protein